MVNFPIYVLGIIGWLFATGCHSQQPIRDRQKGALIGKLKKFQHDVQGTVWAIDEDVLYIENFHYDGIGPDAFFWVGEERQPSPRGFIVPHPVGTPASNKKKLPRFRGENVILRLPSGQKISGLKYLSVWCRRFTVDFGHVLFPANLETPKKRVLPEFKRLAHGVRSGNVTILDAKTFYIPNLHYDGTGPDAFFWVGKGLTPNQNGQKISNEIGSTNVLRGYEGEDIEIQLPDNMTVYDIDYLSIWCVAYRHDFGHVLIPDASQLWVPPALGQTRIKPQKMGGSSLANCHQINDDFQVEWQASNHDVQIRLSGRIDADQYMAFGLSPDENRPVMINGDIVVTYYNSNDGSFHADDYTMSSKAQCDGSFGVCPDTRLRGENDATVISGERHNGVTSITYSRPYEASDRSDIAISRTSKKVAIIAAIGPLNSRNEANYHTAFSTKRVISIDFAGAGENNCAPLTKAPEEKTEFEAWKPNVIQSTNNFSVTIGPTGGDKGYKAITGNPSWGYAFWLNDLLIPVVHVERGQTYYFSVESGNDFTNPAKYHPFYITESSEGGFSQKTSEEQSNERIFAGVSYSKMGIPEPTALGRLCEWKHKSSTETWRNSASFKEFQKTLHKVCEPGLSGSLTWTVMDDTPDVVYYQCYTHRHLGWKIYVHDRGTKLPVSGGEKSSIFCFWLIFLLGAAALR